VSTCRKSWFDVSGRLEAALMPSFLDQLEQRLLHTAGDTSCVMRLSAKRDILSISSIDNVALRSLHFVVANSGEQLG
jgi:hypothetical protein